MVGFEGGNTRRGVASEDAPAELERVLHTGLTRLSCGLTMGVALAAMPPGEPFLDLTYEQAVAQSSERSSFLIVVAESARSPCDRLLEPDAWLVPSLRHEFRDGDFAIRLDVDAQPEVAAALHMEATPTLIAFIDGVEFDRTRQPRPEGWIHEASASLSYLDRPRPREERLAGIHEVDARLGDARAQLARGDGADALQSYVWLWSRLRDIERDRGDLVLTIAGEMAELRKTDALARGAFDELGGSLEATAQAIVDGSSRRPPLGADVVNGVIARNVRFRLARLHAAGLLVGQQDAAVAIGRLLIGRGSDRDDRLALVGAGLGVGRTCPEHAAWLVEADEMGAHVAVSALRESRDALLATADVRPADGR